MKKTVQIHIGGRHFQIDEDAYQKLKSLSRMHLKPILRLTVKPELEIVEDIEQRVAELLENKISKWQPGNHPRGCK